MQSVRVVTRGLRIAGRSVLVFLLLLTLLAAGLHLALKAKVVRHHMRKRVETALSRRLQVEVHVGKITLGPFLNFFELHEIVVTGPQALPLSQVGSVRFYPDFGSLLRGVPAARSVVFRRPVINLSDRLEGGARSEGWILPVLLIPSKVQDLLAIQVDRLQIREGELTYRRQRKVWNIQGLDADLWTEQARVVGEVRVEEGTLHLPRRSLTWGNLEALVVLTEQDLVVTRLGVDVGGGAVGMTGRISDPFGERAVQLTLTAGLPLTGSPDLPGSIRVEGQLTGSAQAPRFKGGARLEGEKWPDLRVELSADREGVRGERLRLIAAAGEVSGGFSLQWKDLTYSAEIRGQGLELDQFEIPLRGALPVSGVLALHAVAEGRGLAAADLKAQATFQVALLARRGEPEVVGKADGFVQVQKGGVSLERLQVELPPNRLTMTGPLWRDVNLEVLGRFPRVDLFGPLLGVKELGGKGRVDGHLMGPLSAPKFRGSLTWDAARLLKRDFKRIRGEIQLEQRHLIAPRLVVARGKTTGTIRLRLALPKKQDGFDLKRDLWIEAEGQIRGVPQDFLSLFVQRKIPMAARMTLDASVEGVPGRIKGRGHVLLRDAAVLGEPWQAAEADLELEPERLLFKKVRLARASGHVTGSGVIHFEDRETTFRLAGAELSLEAFRLFAETGLRGTMRMNIQGEGRLESPTIRGDYQLTDLRYHMIPLESGQGSFLLHDRTMTAQLTLPERGYAMDGSLQTAPPYSYTLHGAMKQADLAPLLALTELPLLMRGTGTGSGVAEVRGNLKARRPSQITLELDAPSIRLDGHVFHAIQPVRLQMIEDTLTVSSLALTGKTGWLDARGQIAFHGMVDFDVQGKIPLPLLLRRLNGVTGATGKGQLDVKVTGPWKAPRYIGWVKVDGAGLRLAAHPGAFEGIRGWAKLQGRKIEIPRLQGRWAGGKVKLSGKASRGNTDGWRWVLDVVVDEAAAERVLAKEEGGRARVTGRTSVRGTVTATGSRWGELRQSLEGKLRLVLEKGKVERFTLLANILRLINLRLDPVKGVPYDHLTAVFDLRQGVVETHDLKFVSDTVKLGGVGTVDLVGGEVDMLLGVQPLRTLDKVINFLRLSKIPLIGHLLFGEEQSVLVIAVKVTGSLAKPRVVSVPHKSLGRGIFGVLRRLLELPVELFPDGKSGTPQQPTDGIDRPGVF